MTIRTHVLNRDRSLPVSVVLGYQPIHKVELSARHDDLGIDNRLVAGEPLPRRRKSRFSNVSNSCTYEALERGSWTFA